MRNCDKMQTIFLSFKIEKKRAREDVRKDKRRGRRSRKGDNSVDKREGNGRDVGKEDGRGVQTNDDNEETDQSLQRERLYYTLY